MNWRSWKTLSKEVWRGKLLSFNCALAMDGSTDATDTAQHAIFIRGNDDQYVTEKMASLEPLKDTA